MVALIQNRLLPLAVAFLALTGPTGAADAGWITLRNDTDKVVVVQGSVTCGGQLKRYKPVRLLPGESVREFQPAGEVKVEVFDGKTPGRSLYAGTVTVTAEKQAFAVGADAKGVAVTAVVPRRK